MGNDCPVAGKFNSKQQRITSTGHACDIYNYMEKKIAVIGLGYVGLPLAVEFAKNGFKTIGLDVSTQKVDSINAGNGVLVPNPITKEQFVQQCCINFMLNITKNYLLSLH